MFTVEGYVNYKRKIFSVKLTEERVGVHPEFWGKRSQHVGAKEHVLDRFLAGPTSDHFTPKMTH